MTTQKLSEIKAKVRRHVPEILVIAATSAGVVALIHTGNKVAKSANLQTEPDRLAGPNMIVLENVESNMWRDMDEPDNKYWLNPAIEE